MSDSLTQTAQAKEAFANNWRRWSRERNFDDDLAALISAVLADHDAQTRQAFEAGWMAAVRGQLDPDAPRLVAPAYAEYLAAPPAQKGTL